MGKAVYHFLSKLYLLTQSSSFLVDHRTTTVALHPTLCQSVLFAPFQVFPIFSSSFNLVFFQQCSGLPYPHLLFIFDCTITCMQIKFLLTLLVSMLFYSFPSCVIIIIFAFQENQILVVCFKIFNYLLLLRHCFS